MSSELMPKNIEKKDADILPFTKCWMKSLSSVREFNEAEREIRDLLWLKNAGLTYDEVELYQANEAGLLDRKMKITPNDMEIKLEAVYCKMKKYAIESKSSEDEDVKSEATNANHQDDLYKAYQVPLSYYPEGHPMNRVKEMEVDVFGHLYADNIPPLSKRRKMLRRFERKKDRVLAHEKQVNIAACGLDIPIPRGRVRGRRRRRLSDMDIEMPREGPFEYECYLKSPRNWYEHAPAPRNRNDYHPGQRSFNEHPECWRNRKDHHLHHKNCNEPIGPRNKQMFTIRGNQIFRVGAIEIDINGDREDVDDGEEDAASEIAIDDQLLEGTKMSIDNIRNIDRFKDYDPGMPSKALYLKNIAPEVTQEQVSVLFNQFILANGGPVQVRLMTSGRMRGQAFVEFQREEICIQALSEANGTILRGQPIIAQFGRANDQRPDDNR